MRKFLLTTNADNCFNFLNKFPDCTLHMFTLFVAQISTRIAVILFNAEWNNGFTTNWSWKYTKSHVVSGDLNHDSYYKLPLYFFMVFSAKKQLVKNQSKILTTNCNPVFLLASDWLTKLIATICFCSTSQGTIKS